MGKTLLIEVTADDIAAGERESCYHCPVARAISRAGFAAPSVKKFSVWINGATNIPLPVVAQEFIAAFDRDDDVRPFSFALDLP